MRKQYTLNLQNLHTWCNQVCKTYDINSIKYQHNINFYAKIISKSGSSKHFTVIQ